MLCVKSVRLTIGDQKNVRALASVHGWHIVLPASVCNLSDLGVEDEKMKQMHEMNCWECKWGIKGKSGKDGVMPLTCSNDNAVTFDITESVTLCSDFEHKKSRRRRK